MLYRDRRWDKRSPRTTAPDQKAEPVSDLTGLGLDGIPTLTEEVKVDAPPSHDPYASFDHHYQNLEKKIRSLDTPYVKVLETMELLKGYVENARDRFLITSKIIQAGNPKVDLVGAINHHIDDLEGYAAVISNVEEHIFPVAKINSLKEQIDGRDLAIQIKKRQIQELTVSIQELTTETDKLRSELSELESSMVTTFSEAVDYHLGELELHRNLLSS